MLLSLGEYMPILIYILLSILIILLIIICIKVIRAMNKIELIIDDVDKKVKSLNGVFSVDVTMESVIKTSNGYKK